MEWEMAKGLSDKQTISNHDFPCMSREKSAFSFTHLLLCTNDELEKAWKQKRGPMNLERNSAARPFE
jgi:hypothetical protein